jgi:hypothetical protein
VPSRGSFIRCERAIVPAAVVKSRVKTASSSFVRENSPGLEGVDATSVYRLSVRIDLRRSLDVPPASRDRATTLRRSRGAE